MNAALNLVRVLQLPRPTGALSLESTRDVCP